MSFWKNWVLAGAIAFFAAALLLQGLEPIPVQRNLLIALCAPAAVWVFFVLFPQIMFKSELRRLEIGPGGIDTDIGGQRAHRDWHEISSIIELDGVIALIVERTGNAFLVPDRAFESTQQRDTLLRQARVWSAEARASA